MNYRAEFMDQQQTRSVVASFLTPVKTPAKKKRMSHTDPKLPEHRFLGNEEDHVPVLAKNQERCVYCKYNHFLVKINGQDPLPKISRPQKKCLACGDHLCDLHFTQYHQRE